MHETTSHSSQKVIKLNIIDVTLHVCVENSISWTVSRKNNLNQCIQFSLQFFVLICSLSYLGVLVFSGNFSSKQNFSTLLLMTLKITMNILEQIAGWFLINYLTILSIRIKNIDQHIINWPMTGKEVWLNKNVFIDTFPSVLLQAYTPI